MMTMMLSQLELGLVIWDVANEELLEAGEGLFLLLAEDEEVELSFRTTEEAEGMRSLYRTGTETNMRRVCHTTVLWV